MGNKCEINLASWKYKKETLCLSRPHFNNQITPVSCCLNHICVINTLALNSRCTNEGKCFFQQTAEKCAAEQVSTVIQAAEGSRLSAAPQWDTDRTVCVRWWGAPLILSGKSHTNTPAVWIQWFGDQLTT